jgi:hypothetical protein
MLTGSASGSCHQHGNKKRTLVRGVLLALRLPLRRRPRLRRPGNLRAGQHLVTGGQVRKQYTLDPGDSCVNRSAARKQLAGRDLEVCKAWCCESFRRPQA